jgi:transcriptional regulator with XRE-family HTH domain
MTPADPRQLAELGAFLQAARARLQPEDVGIGRRGRRRVPGLRRHEVADLAGVSLTWYTWLEQGRNVNPSPEVIDALARALSLDDDGRRHLRRVAGCPLLDTPFAPEEPSESLVGLINELDPIPAYIVTAAFDFVAWNPAYAGLFADPAALPPERRNALWMFFTRSEVRERIPDWASELDHLVGRFRAEAGRHPNHPRFTAIVEGLRLESPEFAASWAAHRVQRFAGRTEEIDHPVAGRLRTVLLQLRPSDQRSLTVMIHQPADEACRRRLTLLRPSRARRRGL